MNIQDIMLACAVGHLGWFLRNNCRLTKSTLEARDEYGDFPLMVAAVHGHVPVMRYLVSKGVYVNQQYKENLTALDGACKFNKNLYTIEFLLDNGADPNNVDSTMHTSLDYALYDNNIDMTKLMLRYGAMPEFARSNTSNVAVKMWRKSPRSLKWLVQMRCFERSSTLRALLQVNEFEKEIFIEY